MWACSFGVLVVGYANALLLVGLVALYAREFKAVGVPGLVGFLEAFIGMALGPLRFVWTSVLASMGWILFGALSVYAEIYSSGRYSARHWSGALRDSQFPHRQWLAQRQPSS